MKRAARQRGSRGLALVELLIAVTVLAAISTLIYSAFSSMRRSRDNIQALADRYREGRMAMDRITRDLSSAYLSQHLPIDVSLAAVRTAFVATPGTPASRVSFNTFAHRRLRADVHESDQAEVSYFGSDDPEQSGVVDLARRSARPDAEPQKGGRVDVLATDIDLFDLEYLDPVTGLWVERWDSTAVVGQLDRLPLQVRITLVLNGGRQGPLRLSSTVALHILKPLSFAADGARQ